MRQGWWMGAWLLLAVAARPAWGEVKLHWKLKVGDRFYVEEKTVQKQTMRFMGSDIKQDLSHTRVSRFTVLEKTATGLVVEQKIEKVRIDQASGTGQTDAKLVRDLEGAIFKVTLGKHMRVIRFEGYEDLIKKFMKNEAVAKMIRVLMPEAVFSQAAEALFGIVPDRPVDPGATWTRRARRPLGFLGTLKLDETFTFRGPAKGEGKDVVRIDMALKESTYQLPAKTDILEFRIVKGNLAADRKKTTRTIYFNTATGRMERSVSSARLTGSMTVAAMGQMLQMAIDQDESVTARILAKNPIK